MRWRMQKHPKERLFALDGAEKGWLRLVPTTHKMQIAEKPVPLNGPDDVAVADGTKIILGRNVGSACASEFFVMRVTNEEKKANMKIKMFQVNVDGVHVGIPCAVNSKAIVAGKEVLVYKPAQKKETKTRVVAAMLEPQAKRSKSK